MKSQASEALHPQSLQSKTPFFKKIESQLKALRVLHGRLHTHDGKYRMGTATARRQSTNYNGTS